ncbi:putative Calmodulin binding protein [Tripterygium wilfordii]|uniref:Putative Calmodulin binding protein n=1 Tax=Tripterygium wilfordii TaxID=458696 RepID=A0A7J7CNP2_TRIWF|nr:putative Calmodulin binding protein [Tripterygium wilfordii]
MENPSNRQHEAAIIRLQRAYKSFRTIRKLADCAVLVGEKWWESPKVAKGLSTKGYKARNMVSLHWLEVIDPRHRHGHNLHFYYEKWLQCHSKEHFFSWLDLGDGKKINLDECPRLILQQRRVNYLGPEVSRQSGHYRPTEENLGDFISFLKENNVDLTYVQIMTSINEEK